MFPKVPRGSQRSLKGSEGSQRVAKAFVFDSGERVRLLADGSVKMMTTIEDVAEVIWHLEAAKHALMTGDVEE